MEIFFSSSYFGKKNYFLLSLFCSVRAAMMYDLEKEETHKKNVHFPILLL